MLRLFHLLFNSYELCIFVLDSVKVLDLTLIRRRFRLSMNLVGSLAFNDVHVI